MRKRDLARERLAQANARAKYRDRIAAIKNSQGCKDCGETHPACLQFHHIDPATKLFAVNRAAVNKIPIDRLMAEIAKCELLCANCHAKRHWTERQAAAA